MDDFMGAAELHVVGGNDALFGLADRLADLLKRTARRIDLELDLNPQTLEVIPEAGGDFVATAGRGIEINLLFLARPFDELVKSGLARGRRRRGSGGRLSDQKRQPE